MKIRLLKHQLHIFLGEVIQFFFIFLSNTILFCSQVLKRNIQIADFDDVPFSIPSLNVSSDVILSSTRFVSMCVFYE